eukprot:TRINITY_DN12239_c0_g1_i2.p2 TRINITY_DN12239_c0_g1~~TRINITY_DN12239_c0_g1_i2.p2  ORF type:complete len:105 (-),score=19.99 TRINITY_DN12239_c0_g1_i2:87-401(-)
MLLLLLSLLIHVTVRPYRQKADNAFESATLTHALLTFYLTTIAQQLNQVYLDSKLVLTVLDVMGYILFAMLPLLMVRKKIKTKIWEWRKARKEKQAEREHEKTL